MPVFVQVYEVILPPPKLRELGEIQKIVIVNRRTVTGGISEQAIGNIKTAK